MKTLLRQRLGRVACSLAAAALTTVGLAYGQQNQADSQPPGPSNRSSSADSQSASSQSQPPPSSNPPRRQELQATRQDARDTIQQARRDLRDERRQFRTDRLRAGDIGLWLRRTANRLTVADVNRRGTIGQAGLQEGDEIVSVNGQHVNSEREFIDALFANHQSNQPAKIVVNRHGQQQTVSINPNVLVDEHLSSSNRLHEYGIILDDTNPDRLLVQAVVPRSPAFYAGLRRGDQITGVRGQRITALAGLIRSLANNAGQTTPIDVNRNDQQRQLDIEVPSDASAETRTAQRPAPPHTAPNTPPNAAPPRQPPQPAQGQPTPPQPNPQR